MAEKVLDLGRGLEIWKVDVDELKEQDVNARAMPKPMFERLTQTIKRDERLESLPFCALTDAGIEIISGHHRTRAYRAAGLRELYVIVDVTGLSRDKIRAKQLAHNSIQGQDNEQIVRQIYQAISDAEAKLEAFIDAKFDVEVPKVAIHDIVANIDYKSVLCVFLPSEKQYFEQIAQEINNRYDALYLAERKQFEPFCKVMNQICNEYEIRSVATALNKMTEIAANYLGQGVPASEGRALRDIFGTAYIPESSAAVIEKALEVMKERGVITAKNMWQAIEYWAADYLAGGSNG